MNLALHQFRHELRRGRLGLVIYLLILLGSLTVVAGWIGGYELLPGGHWGSGGIMPVLLLIGFWVALANVVSACVIADSPARPDRFLSTRPLPVPSLAVGKILYGVVAILLPAALIEALSLAIAGAPGGVILAGGLERFVLVAIVASGIAAFAAHWANAAHMLLAAAASFGAAAILGNLVAVAVRSTSADLSAFTREPTVLTLLQGAVVLTIGLTLTAWLRSRHALKVRWLIPAFALFLCAAFVAMGKTPLRTAPFRGVEQARLTELETATPFRVIGAQFSTSAPWTDSPDLNLNCQVTPHVDGIPEDWDLRWRLLAETWTSDGTRLKHASYDDNLLASNNFARGSVALDWPLVSGVQRHLGKQALFMADRYPGGPVSTLSAGSLRYSPLDPSVNRPARLRSSLAADAFRWRVVADLPLTPGSTDGNWRLAGVSTRSGTGPRLCLVEQAINLRAIGQAERRHENYRWQVRNQFALYLPAQGLVWMGGIDYPRRAAGLSAARSIYGDVEFSQDRSIPALSSPGAFTGARLLVLQSEFVGRIVVDWQSPEVTLHPEPTERRNERSLAQEQDLSPAQFAAWFHQWEKIDPTAAPATVEAHLAELFAQVARCERPGTGPQEPAVLYAARFVPLHLDVLISQTGDYRSEQFLTTVLVQGAEDSQRTAIIERIPERGLIAAVAIARGWIRQSPEAAAAIIRSNGLYANDLFASLLALQDPELYPLLLDFYRTNPSTYHYLRLRQVPALAAETERITTALWKPGRIVLSESGVDLPFKLALLQGRPEALEELFTIVHFYGPTTENNWALVNLLSEIFRLPDELRKDRQRGKRDGIVKWILQHSASDFEWDPVFRRFALKSSNNTI